MDRGRGFAVAAVAVTGPVWFALEVVALSIATCGLLRVGEVLLGATRAAADLSRRLAGRWGGVPVGSPYRPPPPDPEPDAEGWYRQDNIVYRSPRLPRWVRRVQWLAEDPATGRDLDWFLTNAVVGLVLGLAAAVGGRPVLRLHARWSARKLGPAPDRSCRPNAVVRRLLATWRLLVLGALSALNFLVAVLAVLALLIATPLGAIVVWPRLVDGVRWLAGLNRRLARDWSGVEVGEAYLPVEPPVPTADGLYRSGRSLVESPAPAWRSARLRRALRDPATWRDLLWLAGDLVVGGLGLALPGLLWLFAAGFWVPLWWAVLGVFLDMSAARAGWTGFARWLVDNPAIGMPAGLLAAAVLVLLAPITLRWHGYWARLLLAPTERALLAQRVEQLTETRTDATEAETDRLRDIERDLHDGPQARLVSLGLKLAAAEQLLATEPERARALLAEGRDESGAALAELRGLVRGIRPPVLAERGLGDAVRAFALESAAPVEAVVDLPGRCPPAVEAAAYFATRELVTNAVKHAAAAAIRVEVSHDGTALRITVTDDGSGGAVVGHVGGLAGIRRRLGTFDGALALSSPDGGPTRATLEIPCASSSPKTSSSSGTA
ncbi:sensor histidine kinase [Saccharopolyspora sp. CA-218241]|uniref:sensor histidine kinase n=1 Tax=Saccharopolyspora sp. CA-218241 TaxID=3240027 RepID=UPI003D999FE8